MTEKGSVKVSLLAMLLLISIIAIIIMGMYIYKLKNDKIIEIDKNTALQAQVDTLNESVNNLQSKMNLIADTIASTTYSNSNSNSNLNSKSNTNSTLNNNSTNVVTSIEDKIIGTWKADSIVNLQGEELGLSNVFGTGVIQSNGIEFRKNGVLLYGMGITPSSDNGKYTISGNTINYGVPTDIKGEYVWSTFTYNPEEDTLEEEIEPFDEKVIVTYVRAK